MTTVWRVTRGGIRRPGYVWVWIDANGALPAPCSHCGETVTEWGKRKGQGAIHHLDEDRSNNDPVNLALMHHGCHTSEHKLGVAHSEEHRQRIGDGNRRRVWTDESRRKVSESLKAYYGKR